MTPRARDAEPSPGRRARWAITLALVTLFSLLAISSSTATRPDDGPLERVELKQSGRMLVLSVRTDRQIALRRLNRRPDFRSGDSRYLCLEIKRIGQRIVSRICVGGRNGTYHQLGVSRTSRRGTPFTRDLIPARVKRVGSRKLVVTFDPRDARLAPGPYEWRMASANGRCDGTGVGANCATFHPRKRHVRQRLKPVRIVGCTGGNGQVLRHGPRGRREVALTFDDGPSAYTDQVLRVLRKHKAKATFFVLGSLVDAYPDLARRILSEGHELANHSSNHAMLPGASDVARASRTIRKRTGFKPCLFRPPYGAVSQAVKRGVKDAGMKTVLWDVDTFDWRLPGSGSIAKSITKRTRPGSIVLMHDGGGPRSQTVAALPEAIRVLRKRGYRFVTVTDLLGNRFLYRPGK